MNDDTDQLPSSGRYSARAQEVIQIFDDRVHAVFQEVQQQPFWKALLDPTTPAAVLQSIFRNVFLAIYWYQKHTTEAGFLMISRLPKHETRLIKLTILHKVEESEHGEWALRDFLLLGGDEKVAKEQPPSPATFSVASTWWRMGMIEDPLGYFGAEYLFEYLTLLVAQPLLGLFTDRGMKADGLRFIIDHATEDEKHAKLVKHLIMDCVTRYPESEAAMIRCFDYFRQVYPLPVWTEAYHRAQADSGIHPQWDGDAPWPDAFRATTDYTIIGNG